VGNPSCKIKDKFRNVIGVFMDSKHNGVERPKHQKGVQWINGTERERVAWRG
jgi:hypothetical protein